MATSTDNQQKAIHSLILDTGPLIKNAVQISTLINSAEELYTTPAILSEIRDEATRSRVQTTLLPFLKIRNPGPASYDAVIAFSKKTGDHVVLSRQDLGILALAYEVHCERNGGPSGLRDAPKPVKRKAVREETPEKVQEETQESALDEIEPTEAPAVDDGWEQPTGKRATKRKAAKPMKFKYEVAEKPVTQESQAPEEKEQSIASETAEEQGGVAITPEQITEQETLQQPAANDHSTINAQSEQQKDVVLASENTLDVSHPITSQQDSNEQESLEQDVADLTISSPPQGLQEPTPPATDSSASDSDSDGDWITPSNLGEHQAKDSSNLQTSKSTTPSQQISSATMTTDFAMQNVLLQMNLTLLSPNMQRIKHVNTKVLRCHACFSICKDMTKQFCPRCGQNTLAKVSCSTNSKGEFRIHLARNYQYNKRGDKYSIPKPVAGTANGKWSGIGGGKGGWGRDLILAEDQKEFVKSVEQEKRGKTRDLMDEDYLPGILTGDRGRAGGRVKVGAGKNVNAKKRV